MKKENPLKVWIIQNEYRENKNEESTEEWIEAKKKWKHQGWGQSQEPLVASDIYPK